MISGTFLALAFATIVLGYFLIRKQKWKNSPPGPTGLPLLGSLLSIDPLIHKTYSKWAKEYGPIFRVDLGLMKTVVISDHKLLKEMFSEHAFSGRMDFRLFQVVQDGNLHGIINTEGEHWEELRRFTLRQLRDFGFGKNSMEDGIMIEVNELLETLKQIENKPVDNLKDLLHFAVVNSLWAVVTGQRYKQNDSELLSLTRKANEAFNDVTEKGSFLVFIPELAHIAPNWSGYNKIRKNMEGFADYFRAPITEHKKSLDENYDRDFMDAFLKEIKKTKDPKSAFYGKCGEDNLLSVLSDIYFAGTDTTSSTLSWMFLYLSKMPEIQRKFQAEIEAVTGNTRPCSVKDRPNMPYTEAVLAETLRYSSIVAIGVQHKAVKDQEFHGFLIPKDCLIASNIHYIHNDPKIWGDPENFRPERFLSPDGKTFKKHEALIAFSVGRRQCLGESLARDSLFLFATNMFQRFSIEFDRNGPDHGLESRVTFILTPKPYRLIFKDRLQ